MKKALMIIAIIALVAIAGSMIYYFVFFRPEKEKAEIRLQVQKLQFEEEKQASEELRIKNEELRIENEKKNTKQEELNKKTALTADFAGLDKWYNEALDESRKVYHADWDLNCKNRGLAPGSPLPSDIGKGLDDRYQKDIELINKRYQDLKDNIYKLYE